MTDAQQQEIYQHICEIMQELFEYDHNQISWETNLRDDLDIDSIDTVDLLLALKAHVGRKIEPAEFKNVHTIGDVVQVIQGLMNTNS